MPIRILSLALIIWLALTATTHRLLALMAEQPAYYDCLSFAGLTVHLNTHLDHHAPLAHPHLSPDGRYAIRLQSRPHAPERRAIVLQDTHTGRRQVLRDQVDMLVQVIWPPDHPDLALLTWQEAGRPELVAEVVGMDGRRRHSISMSMVPLAPLLSSDGDYAILSPHHVPPGQSLEMHILPLDDGPARVLRAPPLPEGGSIRHAVSPDGRRLAVQLGAALLSYDLLTGQQRTIVYTAEPQTDWSFNYLRWSPDNRHLALGYSTLVNGLREQRTAIYALGDGLPALEHTLLQPNVDNLPSTGPAFWSAGGRRLAYLVRQRLRPGFAGWALWVLDIESGHHTRHIPNIAGFFEMDFGLLLDRHTDEGRLVESVSFDGDTRHRLVEPQGRPDTKISIVPFNNTVQALISVWWPGREAVEYRLVAVGEEGRPLHQIDVPAGVRLSGGGRRDGRFVAYVLAGETGTELFVLDIQRGTFTSLPPAVVAELPTDFSQEVLSWELNITPSPDGRHWLARYQDYYQNQGRVFIAQPDEGRWQVVPVPATLAGVFWSPDSARVAFNSYAQHSNVPVLYVLEADGDGLRTLGEFTGYGPAYMQWGQCGSLTDLIRRQ